MAVGTWRSGEREYILIIPTKLAEGLFLTAGLTRNIDTVEVAITSFNRAVRNPDGCQGAKFEALVSRAEHGVISTMLQGWKDVGLVFTSKRRSTFRMSSSPPPPRPLSNGNLTNV